MDIDKALQESRERFAMIMRKSEKEHDPAMLRAYEKAERDFISEINAERRKGRMEGRLEIARNFKAMGLPIEQIIQGTGLDSDSIKNL